MKNMPENRLARMAARTTRMMMRGNMQGLSVRAGDGSI